MRQLCIFRKSMLTSSLGLSFPSMKCGKSPGDGVTRDRPAICSGGLYSQLASELLGLPIESQHVSLSLVENLSNRSSVPNAAAFLPGLSCSRAWPVSSLGRWLVRGRVENPFWSFHPGPGSRDVAEGTGGEGGLFGISKACRGGGGGGAGWGG